MATDQAGPDCPLCGQPGSAPYHIDHWREYRCCGRCGFVLVPAAYHLSPEAERAAYDCHENEVDDPGYRRFLSRVAEPVMERVAPPATGLDFGCGPGPALAAMLREAGYRVTLYDPFYAPDAAVLTPGYDFITATEVVEHLSQPGVELRRLVALLRPGGWLAIMTKRVQDRERFAGWHYIRDPTHIGFFSAATFSWWAEAEGLELELPGPDVALLRRPDC